MTGTPALVGRIASGGVLDSGGGANHYAAMTVAAFCLAGRFEPHVAALRSAYAERSALLATALQAELPHDSTVIVPRGGFFTWVHLPNSIDATLLLPHAEANGVAFIPGSRFFIGNGGQNSFRLAHSLYGPADLIEASARLGRAVQMMKGA
jgi:DNA-binding transcriptional MocR family regulator